MAGRQIESRLPRELWFATTQLAVWAGLYGIYLLVRSLAIENADHAFDHAAQLIRVEHATGLLQETHVQRAISSVTELRVFFDLYYMVGFGPVLGSSLVWLGLRHRRAYRELRTAMLASLGLALVFFVLYPTAPPRLVDSLGIVDTVGLSGHDTGSFAGIHFDPYAAMPSMHVGWSLLLALVVFRVARNTLLRLLLALHPLLMTLAVVVTGNHFFVDAVAGMVVALVGYALVSCRALQLVDRTLYARPAGLGSARCPAMAGR